MLLPVAKGGTWSQEPEIGMPVSADDTAPCHVHQDSCGSFLQRKYRRRELGHPR